YYARFPAGLPLTVRRRPGAPVLPSLATFGRRLAGMGPLTFALTPRLVDAIDFFTIFSSRSFTRVCQRGPPALKWSTTKRSSLTDTICLVGARCAPHCPRRRGGMTVAFSQKRFNS